VIQGLDPRLFMPESVPPATLVVTERLRRQGATAPALSKERIEQLQGSPPSAAGALAVEPPSERAIEHVIDGPGGPLRLRVLRPGRVRACYLHVHGGGWRLGGPDRQDRTLLRFATAANMTVVAVDYRLTPEPVGFRSATTSCWAAPWRLRTPQIKPGDSIRKTEITTAAVAFGTDPVPRLSPSSANSNDRGTAIRARVLPMTLLFFTCERLAEGGRPGGRPPSAAVRTRPAPWPGRLG
jgi:alpha/beta hydrolase fold